MYKDLYETNNGKNNISVTQILTVAGIILFTLVLPATYIHQLEQTRSNNIVYTAAALEARPIRSTDAVSNEFATGAVAGVSSDQETATPVSTAAQSELSVTIPGVDQEITMTRETGLLTISGLVTTAIGLMLAAFVILK